MSNKVVISNNAALAAHEQVMAIYREADETARNVGTRTARALVAWMEATPPELIMAATDRELVGIEAKTTAAVRLSQTRAIYRVFRDAPADLDAVLSSDRGWNAILEDVRAIVKALKEESAIEREVKAAAKVLAVQKGAKPEDVKAELAAYEERLREFKADQALQAEEQRKADADDPIKVAERLARRLIKAKSPEFAYAVADALANAIAKVMAESEAEREAAEA